MSQHPLSRLEGLGFSDTHIHKKLVKDTTEARQRLISVVARFRGRKKYEINTLASELCEATEMSSAIIDRLQGEVQLLKQEKADLQSSSRRFTCFGRLPPEIRFMIWKLAATETYAPKVFQVHIERWMDLLGDTELSLRYPRHNLGQVCRESRYLLHPLEPKEQNYRTMSQERRRIVERAMDYSWSFQAGWSWFNGALDSIFFSEPMLRSARLTSDKALHALEALVGPIQHVLVPWPVGDDLLSSSHMFTNLHCLGRLETLGFVMARRKVKQSVRAHFPILPLALDIDDEVAVKNALSALGDGAGHFTRDLRYFKEPGFLDDIGPTGYWFEFQQTILEDWLLVLRRLDPPSGNDIIQVWAQEHRKSIPAFKRIIMLE